MRFASFLSGGFTNKAVMNQPEMILAKLWTGLEPENKVLFSIKIKLMKLDMRTRKSASKIV